MISCSGSPHLALIPDGTSPLPSFFARSNRDTDCHGRDAFTVRERLTSKINSAVLSLCLLITAPSVCRAADFNATELLYRSGDYAQAAEVAKAEVERGIWNERWARLLLKCQLTTGQYEQALTTYEAAVKRYSGSLTLRLQGVEAMRFNGLDEKADQGLIEIYNVLRRSSSQYASRDNLIAAGRYFVMQDEDARQILKMFYDRVLNADKGYLEAYIATAELALAKGDFKVAAETLDRAELVDGSDPRLHYLLAQAWRPSDSERATEALQRSLELNPQHVDSLLLKVDQSIDSEHYEAAKATIDQVLKINPRHPAAWSYRAVLAHLRGNFEAEKEMRAKALEPWSNNPEVDHLIGRKLSDKYRFEEGSKYQQQSLTMNPTFAPATLQLAQDLLRLGFDDVGWELAETIATEDQYNVLAHNLATLHDRVKEFVVLRRDGIHVRMDAHEASVYGLAVLDLLTEAKQVLCEKYEVTPSQPIIVEIFPDQKDFAIRTFGLPGGAGFLGVCFGRVITANSPASQGQTPSNWQSVLWHEFCHAVTLEKTKNRMPRWLSEGISVYEERQRNDSWGEQMSPRYRQMLLSDNLTPVSQLSGAFLRPKSPLHLQFAYYQSSLVVEFLIEQHGAETLNLILDDLSAGLETEDALAKNTVPLARLDSAFAEFAKTRAEEFAAGADWDREQFAEAFAEGATEAELLDWLADHPKNAFALQALAELQLENRGFDKAIVTLTTLTDLGAITSGSGGTWEQLAAAYRATNQPKLEITSLKNAVATSSDALSALSRLIELAEGSEDWDDVVEYAGQVLAINPLLTVGHRAMADAAQRTDQHRLAADSLTALLAMDPIDPAGLHYRLATALNSAGDSAGAKRHVLLAMGDAPRYRDAQKLLLQIVDAEDDPENAK